MRKQTILLLLLLVLSVWIGRIQLLQQPVPDSGNKQPESEAGQKNKPAIFSPSDTLPVPYYRSADSNLRVVPANQEMFRNRWINRNLTNMLKNRTGSYTNLTDIMQRSGPSAMDLRSSWLTPRLFPDRTLPSLRMRVVQDPETGRYYISGGAIGLPRSGLEAGYESDLNREDYKATLQWKKSF
jgi:hypothetical protein